MLKMNTEEGKKLQLVLCYCEICSTNKSIYNSKKIKKHLCSHLPNEYFSLLFFLQLFEHPKQLKYIYLEGQYQV